MNGDVVSENLDADIFEHPLWVLSEKPINGTDSRRKLEDKMEELRLRKETQEFDFDF